MMPTDNQRPSLTEIYREQRAHHGRMHDTLYGMPPSFAVVIGALWFFAAQQLEQDHFLSGLVFLFSLAVTAYLFRAYTIFAARTEEFRLAVQDIEKEYAFANDINGPSESDVLQYREPPNALAGVMQFLTSRDTIAAYRKDKRPKEDRKQTVGIQAKTREQFRFLMQAAGWVSLIGCVYAWSTGGIATFCRIYDPKNAVCPYVVLDKGADHRIIISTTQGINATLVNGSTELR